MAFADANWITGVNRIVLAQVVLSDPRTKRNSVYTTDPGASPTLLLCDGNVPYVYGGNTYWPLIQNWNGDMPDCGFTGEYGESSGQLTLANARYPFQQQALAAPAESDQFHVKLSQLFRHYIFHGAAVTVTVIVEQPGLTQSEQVVFSGYVHEPAASDEQVVLNCNSSRQYSTEKPDTDTAWGTGTGIITKKDYANAPPEYINGMIPIVYTNAGTRIQGADGLCTSPGFASATWPVPITDGLYDGTYIATAMLAKYPTQSVGGQVFDLLMWVPELETYAFVLDASLLGTPGVNDIKEQVTNDPTAGIFINPTSVRGAGAGVSDAGKAFDGKSTTSASIACTGATQALDLRLPFPGFSLGEIVGGRAWVVLAAGTGAGAAGDTNATFGLWNFGTSNWHGQGSPDYSVKKVITKTNIEAGGYFETDLMDQSLYQAPDWQGWKWQGTYASGATQEITWTIQVSSNGATGKVIAAGIKVLFKPANLRGSRKVKLREFTIQGGF